MGLFTEYDAQTIHDKVIEHLQDSVGEVLPAGDERRIFAESMTAYLVAVLADVEDVAKQKTLKFARGEVLDAIGEMYGCERVKAQPASCTLRFELDEALTDDVEIPQGTVCSTPTGYAFATSVPAVIPAGETSSDVPAVAEEPGTEYNGIVPGGVKIIQTAVSGVTSVSNVDTTSGASDGEADDDEGNESYRQRILEAQNAVNTAGTSASYSYFAKQADANIADVQVPDLDEAYTVNIYVVKTGGELFSDEELANILAVCAADDVRPMGDRVSVLNAKRIMYKIALSYTCPKDTESAVVEAIEGPGGAVDSYISWQDQRISRSIAPQKLMAFCFEAGAETVDVQLPAVADVPIGHVAKCSGITCTHKVV